MPIGFPSIRVDDSNETHHLWCNNGTWWLHYTVHFDHRARRIRRSLRTRSLAEAIRLRDEHLSTITAAGEFVVARWRSIVSHENPHV
jgi:hypothetical protein